MHWKKIEEKTLHEGYRGIIRKRFELPNGRQMDFDIIRNEVYVTIAAFTVDRQAILVRQYRPGPEQILISFPEGAVEEAERAEDAARRELREETGYEAGKVSILKTFRSAYSTEQQICLLAEDCRKVAQQQLDEGEFIEVFTMPLNEFRTYIRQADNQNFTNVDAAYLALDQLTWL